MKSANPDMTGQKTSFFNKWQGNKNKSENPKIKRLKRNQPTAKYGSYFDPDIKQIILKM